MLFKIQCNPLFQVSFKEQDSTDSWSPEKKPHQRSRPASTTSAPPVPPKQQDNPPPLPERIGGRRATPEIDYYYRESSTGQQAGPQSPPNRTAAVKSPHSQFGRVMSELQSKSDVERVGSKTDLESIR